MKTIKNKIFEGCRIRSCCLFIMQLVFISNTLSAQTLYVDAVKGKTGSAGTIDHPLASLEEAVSKTNSFTGLEPVHLKLAPGTYVLTHEMNIKTMRSANDTIRYTFEALIMPDDKNWEQSKMPVISSLSSNARVTPFPCAVGFFIGKNNVNFKGLKFMGNSNVNTASYYPIKREDAKLTGLNISQCYFIGKKEGKPIEGSLWLTGEGIHIDHCIFSNCKTAIILYATFNDFSFTRSIISGSYESAIWSAGYGTPFVFRNNVVTNSKYVMVHPENKQFDYSFFDSRFAGNEHYIGAYGSGKDKQAPVPYPIDDQHITETNIDKTGKELTESAKNGISDKYLKNNH